MKGDRERCLEAGMDDYAPKPIQPQSLLDVIGRWLDKGPLEKARGSSVEPTGAREVFDKEKVMERLDGDEVLFSEILGMFLDDAPIKIERMQEHLKGEDLAGLELQAHSLKGAASYIGGNALQKVAFEIEVAAKNHELDRASILLGSLEKELVKYKKAVSVPGLQSNQVIQKSDI
jgi:HPt (histidine-containing phosphotransfer) domain-containing protein